MDVDAGHSGRQPVERLLWLQPCAVRSSDEMVHSLSDESPGAASGIENVLAQRIIYQLTHHRSRKPVRSVVFAERPALVGRYHSLVQNRGDVRRRPLASRTWQFCGRALE